MSIIYLFKFLSSDKIFGFTLLTTFTYNIELIIFIMFTLYPKYLLITESSFRLPLVITNLIFFSKSLFLKYNSYNSVLATVTDNNDFIFLYISK